jgi:hypothetical protein
MPNSLKKPLSLALGALATATLGGCYYDGDLYGPSYASAGVCANDYYDYDPYAYSDGYGYDCYDPTDYSGGFVQIGFGGGWYDNYYYPGYGMWMFDNYRNRYPLRGQYLNYWGGRRAWWKHRGDRGDSHWQGRPPSRGGDHGGRPHRPGAWDAPARRSARRRYPADQRQPRTPRSRSGRHPPASAGGQHPDDRAWRSIHCTAAPSGWPGCNPHATGAYGRMDRKQATLVSGCDRAACQPHDPGSAATFTCLADAAPAAACGKRTAADASHRRCTAPEPWRPVRTRSRKLTDAGLPAPIRRVMAALRPSCPPTPRSPQQGRRSR